MPSHYEGLGIVAVEAQGCGCVPIVAALSGVTDHSVRHEETGFLVKNRSPMEYAKRLAELAKDRQLWERMSEAGRNKAILEFGIETAGHRYLSCIQGLGGVVQEKSWRRWVGFLGGCSLRDFVPNLLRKRHAK